MPAECSTCGEYTLCRKNIVYCDLAARYGYDEWICQKCDNAKKIINDERIKESKRKEKQNQLNWIKERDRILKQNDK